MAGPEDRRAALLLVSLILAGGMVRLLGIGAGEPAGAVGFRGSGDSRPERDSVAAVASRLARPLRRGERIDMDRAGVEDLTRLPRIGPALAARIVDDRAMSGPFGSIAGLGRVSGVGPAVLAAVGPYASFSGHPTRSPPTAAPRVDLNRATEEQLVGLPGIGPARARAIIEDRARRGRYRSVEELTRIPGIGPVTVQRIRRLVAIP